MIAMHITRHFTEFLFVLPLLLLLIFSIGCRQAEKKKATLKPPPGSSVKHPEWSRNANIYEVNIRQFTPEGTLKAFMAHIPRLEKMGVDILWLMPVTPIGELERKGSLGSYYSVRDYQAVNPEFGTLEDLKNLVDSAHARGMYVILDWVANHTAWDNPWITEHPGWYKKDSTGAILSPYDWSDVAQLDYGKKQLWAAMRDAMKFWLVQTGVDGFRCDVAWAVPIEYWDWLRPQLELVKPVFMLAEAEGPEYHLKAFDMSYAWEMHHMMGEIYQGTKNAYDLQGNLNKQDTLYPSDAYRMNFTSNHDENSWKGTEYERLGESVLAFAVLTATLPGMPLIYNGQESAFNRRLAFFEKDSVDWKDYSLAPFYQRLLDLKHRHQALWNGSWGGRFERIPSGADSSLFVFTREREGEKVLVMTNLSKKVREARLKGPGIEGSYKEFFTGEEATFGKKAVIRLKPWEHRVYVLK